MSNEVKPSIKKGISKDSVFFVKKGKEYIPVPFINDILYITNPNGRKFRTITSIINYIRKSDYPILIIYQRNEKYPMNMNIPYEQLHAIKNGSPILQIVVNLPKFGQNHYLKIILNQETKPMTCWDIFPPSDWTGIQSINHPGFKYIISQLVAEYVSESDVGIQNTFINDIIEAAMNMEMLDSKANHRRSRYQYLKQLQGVIHPMVLFTPTHEFLGQNPEFCDRCGGILNPITKSCYSC